MLSAMCILLARAMQFIVIQGTLNNALSERFQTMRRIALILVAFVTLGFAGGQLQAHDFHHGYGPGHHAYGFYREPVRMPPPAWVPPPPVAAVRGYPPVVYRPRCYEPAPTYGFYYQGRGLSIGIGF